MTRTSAWRQARPLATCAPAAAGDESIKTMPWSRSAAAAAAAATPAAEVKGRNEKAAGERVFRVYIGKRVNDLRQRRWPRARVENKMAKLAKLLI